jgi:two-component system, OmpR family, response regulator
MTNRALKSILYVEDDGDIRTVAEIALVAVGGFELVICSSGKEALEKALSLTPDLLLLDVMMPEMDGPTTLEALRKAQYRQHPGYFHDRQGAGQRGRVLQIARRTGGGSQAV